MNRINPDKLENSKWTAVAPRGGEKHFLVTSVARDEAAVVRYVTLEAVLTRNDYQLSWRDLQDDAQWRPGWVSSVGD